jgi:hypothetical protein
VLEHVKQHMMLWYTQSMRQYAFSNSNLKNKKYEDTKLAPEIDRAMAAASGHVALDIQEKFAQFTPVLQKLLQVVQQIQQGNQNVPLTPDARAVLESSMAETKRRAQRDQGELALKAQKQQQDAKDSADDREVKVVMNTENNLTRERMDTLDLTLEAAKLKKEQAESVTALQEAVQRGLIQ